jgi:hypothetical protein
MKLEQQEKKEIKENNGSILRVMRIPMFLGIVIGILAALVQALLISAGGPEAYGFCVACHTRDLTNKVVNSFTENDLGVAPISLVTPVLTILGVLIGGYIAATRHEEFKVKKGSYLSYLSYFSGGILVLILALFVGACPYRLALRFAYGDFIALIGILSIAGGVALGVALLLYRMKRRGI